LSGDDTVWLPTTANETNLGGTTGITYDGSTPLVLGSGNDTVYGSDASDTIELTTGSLNLTVGSGVDTLLYPGAGSGNGTITVQFAGSYGTLVLTPVSSATASTLQATVNAFVAGDTIDLTGSSGSGVAPTPPTTPITFGTFGPNTVTLQSVDSGPATPQGVPATPDAATISYMTTGFFSDEAAYDNLKHPSATPQTAGTEQQKWTYATLTWDINTGYSSGVENSDKAAIILAIQEWNTISPIRISLTPITSGTPNINFFDVPGDALLTRNDQNNTKEIDFDSQAPSVIGQTGFGGNLSLGSYGFYSLLHEIGHALGLGHSGPYNNTPNGLVSIGNASNPQDSLYSTIMSYNGPYWPSGTGQVYPSTPGLDDVAAIQALYKTQGNPSAPANATFGFNNNTGIAAYTFLSNEGPVVTLVANGVNALDVSGFTAPDTIDLRRGGFSSVDGLIDNIAISYNTVVNTATGGSGGDIFIPNSNSDIIVGGSGINELILSNPHTAYNPVTVSGSSANVTSSNLGSESLTNIQLIQFTDEVYVAGALSVANLLAKVPAAAAAPPLDPLVEVNSTLSGNGTITNSIQNDDSVEASGGALNLLGTIGGSGTFSVAALSTLNVQSAVATPINLNFEAATGTVSFAVDAGSASASVTGFQPGDQVDLNTSQTLSTIVANPIAGGYEVKLTFSGGNSVDLNYAGAFSGTTFEITPASGGTTTGAQAAAASQASPVASGYVVSDTPSQACFCSGTGILTSGAEIPVEALAVGDTVQTVSGTTAAVVWIGHRRVDCRRHPRPHDALPVRIHANAFGHGLPRRDLLLSPDHSVFIDGVLIPIRHLINGASIVREPVDEVTYWHVELPQHDILLAEGLPCESYLDTGNRGAFANGGAPLALHAELVEANEQVRRETGSCKPLATQADRVEPIWQRLAARAAELGYPVLRPAAIMDPQLRVLVGACEIRPISATDDQFLFALPSSPTGMVQIISRAASPSDLRPWLDDRRRLGVSVARIILRDEAGVTEIPVDHPSLVDGWHDVERDGGRLWRWTDGAARLPVPSGPHRLEIRITGSIEYPVETAAAAQVLAA